MSLTERTACKRQLKIFFHDFIVFTFSLLNDCTCILLTVKCIKMCPYEFLCSHVVVSDNAHADTALGLTARFA